MNWERLKAQLELILQTSARLDKVTTMEWNKLSVDTAAGTRSILHNGNYIFPLQKEGTAQHILLVNDTITATEQQLIELTIEAFRLQEKRISFPAVSEEERKANVLRDWISDQLERENYYSTIPDAVASQSSLYSTRIPLLLYGDYSANKQVSYADLKKLLESFFDADIVLVPLKDKEWLILGSESLLADSGGEGKGDGEEESMEESLASICFGLHEMMESEWVGESHLSIHYPMVPAKSLISTVIELRETIAIGRSYHMGSNIHLPWLLHLEKLLNTISAEQKEAFVEQVLKRIDHHLDQEMMMTLEQFFELDCSVSEAAKKLYIHRNTMLYRLDKFKHDTGLDVRTFNDAVLIKIVLVLYKVTKRI